ncbi:MAG: ABC-F family ATP-binding cassette domain-containing protein [Saprospiraceae bacterium]|nr:ABC-F family ATP-binding cassette domain-containing protein [Saprospiraceae bacterium]
MNYLTLENVTKTYGEKTLFNNITLHIDKGQKIALVAKNGTGKSTLLRVLSGIEGSEGENSEIIIRKDIRTGILNQEPDLDPQHTILESVFSSDSPQMKALRDYEYALLRPENTENLEKAMQQMDVLKAWDIENRVKEVLSKLKITDLNQIVRTLSGGQRKRIALAQLLIDEPDFLILDEPTNHLDLDMIEWLEEYLQQPRLTLFMVTHDRYFLDRVCDSIIELDGGQLFRYKGNYSEYLEKKAIRTEIDAVTLDKNKKLFEKELDWIRRQPQARSTKAKSRVDAFYDLKEATSKKIDTDSVQLDIKMEWLGSKIVELHNVGKSYGDKKILENFTYKFRRKERVGIVGPNGAGKSTLIRLLTGEENPDVGKVVIGDTIVFGHYQQDGMVLKEDKRVIEVIQDIAEYIPLEKGLKITASAMLERFLFSKAQQQVYVSQLSGGERRRLYLLTILMKNPNFLILDEPTNDLDILTLNVLEAFLMDYPGCLLVVTHDRYFMDKLVEHLFIFEGNGQIKDYNGQYSDYRAQQKELDQEKSKSDKSVKPEEKTTTQETNKVALTHEEQKELKRVEKEIEKLETKKAEIADRFNDPTITPVLIAKYSKELSELSDQIEEREMRWMELVEKGG